MTSRDEALRALEKKFQDEATVARDTFKYGGGEYYDGRRDAFNLAADELAALIAELGQEVAPVALIEAARDWIAKAPHGDNCYLDPDHPYGKSCYCGKESILDILDSPAHTSEARDAARLDWLERMANVRGGLLLHDGSESGRIGLGLRPGALSRTIREAIDAAMRQEAE